MDEFNKIKKEYFKNQKSIYQIAKEYNRSWDTIDRIIKMPDHLIELRGKRNKLPLVITSEVYNKIAEIITFESTHKVSKKQRFTAKYIYQKLKDECDYKGSSRRIRSIVAKVRKELKTDASKSFLQLDFELGHYLQVDHGEVDLKIKGIRLKGYLFVASVPGASIRYCQFYPVKSSESWGDFHESIFKYFGGVFKHLNYDNDSVLKNNQLDIETTFALELQSHYGFEAIYCNKASGHEKGAVENSVGYCRRNFLAGLMEFDSLGAINGYLENQCNKQWEEVHHLCQKPLKDYLSIINMQLLPYVPHSPWGRWIDLKVNSQQTLSFQDHKYSVPEKFVGCLLKVHASVFKIYIYDGMSLITEHERKYLPGEDSLILDHYLDQLEKKPTAIAHAKVIKDHPFEAHLTTFWGLLKIKHGEKLGNQEFIKVLLLKRQSSAHDFECAIKLALSYQAINSDGVKSIIHQLQIHQVRSLEIANPLMKEEHFNINSYQELQETPYD